MLNQLTFKKKFKNHINLIMMMEKKILHSLEEQSEVLDEEDPLEEYSEELDEESQEDQAEEEL
jgi:hypothetical protein